MIFLADLLNAFSKFITSRPLEMEPILSPETSATSQPTLYTNPERGRSQVRLQQRWRSDKATRSWFAALEGQESYFCKVSTPALGPTQRSSQWEQREIFLGKRSRKAPSSAEAKNKCSYTSTDS